MAEQVSVLLRERSAGVHGGAVMHTPADVTGRALQVISNRAADAVVAVRGGSTVGLGKAIALRTDLPQVVLSKTYAGSEMTPIVGKTIRLVALTCCCSPGMPGLKADDGQARCLEAVIEPRCQKASLESNPNEVGRMAAKGCGKSPRVTRPLATPNGAASSSTTWIAS